MATKRHELPPGWTSATIGQIVGPEGVFVDGDWVESKDQDPSGNVRLIQLADIGDGEFSDKSARFLTSTKADELRCTFLQRGDILVARMPDPLGRACIFPLNGDRTFVTVVDVCIVRLGHDLVDREYLLYAINSPDVRIKIDVHKSGSTRKRISRGNFARIVLPLAPKNEQHWIVAKINELFSELDNGVACLQTAKQQLAGYRSALLRAAFDGSLTADWRQRNEHQCSTPRDLLARAKSERETHHRIQVEAWKTAVDRRRSNGADGRQPSRPREPKEPGKLSDTLTSSLSTLPECWTWEKLGWVTCGVEYGTSAKSAVSGEVPVLRMGNIQNGGLDWSDLVYSSDPAEIERYELHDGDVLFNRTNSPELVGKTALYRGGRSAIFAGYLIRLNHLPNTVDGRYLCYFLNSPVARQYGNTVKTDGVNQSNINGQKLQNFPLPYCSLAEQSRIADILEEHLSIVDDLNATIEKQLRAADDVRQAILRKAFSGQLVDQDIQDEPASVLLERIARENGQAPQQNGARGAVKRRRTGT